MTKAYDRAYFDKWYRDRRTRVSSSAAVRRKVAMAVAVCEYFLRRPLRSVLDVGCGEAAWRQHLLALRPRLAYSGLDRSDYVVERFGRARNIRKAAFEDLPTADLGRHDLVVCSDVLHYVKESAIPPGIHAIAAATACLAFLEVLTREDEIEGDLEGLVQRPAAWYRRVFNAAGLVQVGAYCWLAGEVVPDAAELELAP